MQTPEFISRLFMPLRAWWYLRVAKEKTPPPAIRRFLMMRGIERLKSSVLPPEMQRKIAVEQLTAILDDKDHVFDGMFGDVFDDAWARLAQTAVLEERESLEKKRQEVINVGAEGGASISTDNVLRYVEALKASYDGPNPSQYARDIDQFCNEFLEKHGTQIRVDNAYILMKEIEGKYGKPS